ncbi:hypothetical protein BSKO_06160 [Bryopsis sp. KO-2023]|nr:hypothetical protein BSKO_06160 [Bryopsis sp. KO-2023]
MHTIGACGVRSFGAHSLHAIPTGLLSVGLASGKHGSRDRSSQNHSVALSCASLCPAKRTSFRRRVGEYRRRSSSPAQEAPLDGNEKKDTKAILTIPTILTLARVAAIPVLVIGFYGNSAQAPVICASIFVVAALTDWLDGYLARKLNVKSSFGAFLDPVADKLMVVTTLVMLSSQPISSGTLQGNSWIIPSLSSLIIGREITMSSLREWAASISKEAYGAVAVSGWGKWKTASQMSALVLLLLASGGSFPGLVTDLGVGLLFIASFLTVWSLALYFKGLWPYL